MTERQGIAFCEYVESSSTEIALQGLNGMELGDKRLKVRKASIGITQIASNEMSVNAVSMLAGTTATDSDVTRVLQLLNMVTADELMDNDDYEGTHAPHDPSTPIARGRLDMPNRRCQKSAMT